MHPEHNRQTLQNLLHNIHVYPNGNCVVHHMLSSEVVDIVKKKYDDTHVQSEMFEITMQKCLVGKGVVGSTSNILKFILQKVSQSTPNSSNSKQQKLQFVLETEASISPPSSKACNGY